jgi:DNA modification methylase
VERSKIIGDYEPTNVWRINPAYSRFHPAVFPLELAEKVISYYSFENDVVLDPFAGIGTVGTAAMNLSRRFYLIERERKYIDRFLEVERARFEKSWLTGVIQGQDRPVGKTPGMVG